MKRLNGLFLPKRLASLQTLVLHSVCQMWRKFKNKNKKMTPGFKNPAKSSEFSPPRLLPFCEQSCYGRTHFADVSLRWLRQQGGSWILVNRGWFTSARAPANGCLCLYASAAAVFSDTWKGNSPEHETAFTLLRSSCGRRTPACPPLPPLWPYQWRQGKTSTQNMLYYLLI